MRIERIDDWLHNLKKHFINCTDLIYLKDGDVLFIAAGFEDRSVEVLSKVVSCGSSGFMVVILNYLPTINANKNEEIKELCNKAGVKTVLFTYDRENPAGIGDTLSNIFSEVKGGIFIDVSAMSRLLIVQIIVALGKSSRNFLNATIFYSEALKYPPSEEQVKKVLENGEDDTIYRTMFLSSGVFDVFFVPELSSVALQGQPVRLVAFPSFNVHQLVSLRGEIQPAYLTLIHGTPPLAENEWRKEAIKKLNHIENILNREDMEASTLDYRETLDCLLKIYKKYGTMERIILSPTGSKMQAVAIGIFRTYMDDIQIAYPVPKTFASPKEYTVGVRKIYSLSLDVFHLEQ